MSNTSISTPILVDLTKERDKLLSEMDSLARALSRERATTARLVRELAEARDIAGLAITELKATDDWEHQHPDEKAEYPFDEAIARWNAEAVAELHRVHEGRVLPPLTEEEKPCDNCLTCHCHTTWAKNRIAALTKERDATFEAASRRLAEWLVQQENDPKGLFAALASGHVAEVASLTGQLTDAFAALELQRQKTDEIVAERERLILERDQDRGLLRRIRGLIDTSKSPFGFSVCGEVDDAIRRWDAENEGDA